MLRPYITVTGIDLGTTATRVMTLVLERAGLRVVGWSAFPASGWERGRLVEPQSLVDSIRHGVEEVRQSAGVEIDSAVVGIGGPELDSYTLLLRREYVPERVLRQEDLQELCDEAGKTDLGPDRAILHVFPRSFVLDGNGRHANPLGLSCRMMEAEFLAVAAPQDTVARVIEALHRAHLKVETVVVEPVAAAYASLIPEEWRRGALIVDIGEGSTEYAVLLGDTLVQAGAIPINGAHFVSDVMQVLGLPYNEARLLIEQYGSAGAHAPLDSSTVEIVCGPDERRRSVALKDLHMILALRAEELFEFLAREIEQAGVQGLLGEGVFLCGGVAELDGICEIAEGMLGCPAQRAWVQGILDYPDLGPAWVTAAGLAMYGARLRLRRQARKPMPRLMDLVRYPHRSLSTREV